MHMNKNLNRYLKKFKKNDQNRYQKELATVYDTTAKRKVNYEWYVHLYKVISRKFLKEEGVLK